MNKLVNRKSNRLKEYNYSQNGMYFITICSDNKQCFFCKIVECGILDAPKIEYSEYGEIIKNQIDCMNEMYDNINVEKYIIMPNHLHLIIEIKNNNGASRTPHPTNTILSSFVGTLKRFTNRKAGKNLWQRSFYDHIIRDDEDYITKAQYIENNPAKWQEDEYYI